VDFNEVYNAYAEDVYRGVNTVIAASEPQSLRVWECQFTVRPAFVTFASLRPPSRNLVMAFLCIASTWANKFPLIPVRLRNQKQNAQFSAIKKALPGGNAGKNANTPWYVSILVGTIYSVAYSIVHFTPLAFHKRSLW